MGCRRGRRVKGNAQSSRPKGDKPTLMVLRRRKSLKLTDTIKDDTNLKKLNVNAQIADSNK